MRIAIISDIHGNFVALQTVHSDIEHERIDQIVCLGDVTADGPQPVETIRRIRDLGCPVVRGNTDEWFFVPQTYDPNSEKERKLMAMLEWAMQKFSPDDIAFMQSFQSRVEIPLDDGNTLLCFHGSPQSNTEIIQATTPDDQLRQRLGDYRATVMAGVHTHQQLLRRFHDVTIINPGSVGMPLVKGATPAQDRRPPWSEYAIIDSHGGNFSIEFRRVPLDVRAVVQAARESGMQEFEMWEGGWAGTLYD